MNYKELHLEAIMFPDNIEGLLEQDSVGSPIFRAD